jgi:3-oxoacyl-[acyl-carrier protein] reductase
VDLQLKDSVAVITGSSQGLGLASARALVEEGSRVTICARTADKLQTAADELRAIAGAADRVLAITADVSTPDGAERVVAETIKHFGRVDVLVNNVGKAGGTDIVDTTDEDWHSAIDQTLFPAVRMSRLVVPHMRKQQSGVILMIASIWGRESGGRMTYNAVKAAEISLAKAMSQQLAKDNIRVNSVAPGSIAFEGGTWWKRSQDDPKGMAEFVKREIAFGRFGKAEEVGALVAFLASPKASWITGSCITVDGGQSRSNI